MCRFEKHICFLAKVENCPENVLAELTVRIFKIDEFEIANDFVIHIYIDDTRVFHEGCL